MVWSKGFGSTMFLDGVGGFELASGPTRRYVWEASAQPAASTAQSDRGEAEGRCFSIYATETIAAIDFTGTPAASAKPSGERPRPTA